MVLLVGVRVVVAAVLVLGPATDEAHELRGWDAERFQEIVEAPGRAYRDHEVEYPPGAVALLEVVAGPTAPTTQDRIVLLQLAVDLGVALLLARRWGRPAAIVWLVLGLAMLPGSYLRFDLVSVGLAVLAAALVPRGRVGGSRAAAAAGSARRRSVGAAAALVAAVLVKTWPLVLLPGWARGGRRTALVAASGLGALVGAAWLAWGGTDGPQQVLGFRGASGWHVESTPGLVAGLLTGEDAVRESGAFRLGSATRLVSVPLLVVLLVGAVALWWRAARLVARRSGPIAAPGIDGDGGDRAGHDDDEVDRVDALAALGATCLLLVTAPLLSPQYLLWTLPWAAICWAHDERRVVAAVAAATVLTAGVLAAFGPPGVDVVPAQLLLLVRNGLLAVVPVLAFSRLGRSGRFSRPGRLGAPARPAATSATTPSTTARPAAPARVR